MIKNKFQFVFNDSAFDDGSTFPYVVDVKTKKSIEPSYINERIDKAIEMCKNSDEGMQCSEDGINQIFSYLQDLILSFKVLQYDNSFNYGT